MIALMGAAGNVGSKVADLLLGAHEKVRVLKHDRDLSGVGARGAEVLQGDAMNGEDLRALFDGALAAMVLLPEDVADPAFVENRIVMGHAIADALSATAVPYVVALSAVGAGRADAPGPPGGLHTFEQSLATLETNVLVLRSAAYMDYLLASLPMIRSEKVNGSAVRADVRFPMIATRDVAREAFERLCARDFNGHAVRFLLGPTDVSMEEATTAIGRRLGLADLPYIEFPPDAVRGALIGAGMSAEVAQLVVDMQLAVNDGRYLDGVRRTPEASTPTTLQDFIAEALTEASFREEGHR